MTNEEALFRILERLTQPYVEVLEDLTTLERYHDVRFPSLDIVDQKGNFYAAFLVLPWQAEDISFPDCQAFLIEELQMTEDDLFAIYEIAGPGDAAKAVFASSKINIPPFLQAYEKNPICIDLTPEEMQQELESLHA